MTDERLEPAPPTATSAVGRMTCPNCGSTMELRFCAHCGQRAVEGAPTLAVVLHDAWHDVTHVDGRVWRTLAILMVKPGAATVEYFEGRRARFLPPVRLYLVLSVIFFAFAFTSPTPARLASATAASADESVSDDAIVRAAEQRARARALAAGVALNIDSTSSSPCHVTIPGAPRLERALQNSCLRNVADNGGSFKLLLERSIPRMMFVFLPLVAATMRLLYHRPRRYYVEHLVFLLHNHSALFTSFILVALLGVLGSFSSVAAQLHRVAIGLVVVYAFWYTYAALQRYYRQGRWATLAKYLAIGVCYGICLLFVLLAASMWTALQT
jgi:hypothetical protein